MPLRERLAGGADVAQVPLQDMVSVARRFMFDEHNPAYAEYYRKRRSRRCSPPAASPTSGYSVATATVGA